MTDLGIGESRGRKKETKEKHLKRIKKISKGLGKIKESDFEITEEQKREIKRQEAKEGKIVVAENNEDKDEKLPTLTTYKYSKNGKGDLYESVLIGGQPCFITYNHATSKVEIYPGIQEEFRILYPAEPSEYSYPPYEFESKEELEFVCSAAKKENLDTLYTKSEEIVKKYNEQKSHKLVSIASSVVWSYFQDRFATTRYEILTGGNGGGKSALADTYGAIGYRPVNTTNPTAGSYLQIVGKH